VVVSIVVIVGDDGQVTMDVQFSGASITQMSVANMCLETIRDRIKEMVSEEMMKPEEEDYED